MNKVNVYKTLVAMVLCACVVLMVFYGRDEIRSSAVEPDLGETSAHTEVYFANDADKPGQDVATGTDAVAELTGVGDHNSIKSGDIVYYNGEAYTRFYTVYRDGREYRAYCGDHKKNAVRSTNNVSFAENNDEMIRLAFACGPDSEYAWSGFDKMGDAERQLVMSLTVNYLRHGQYFPVISKYLEYIKNVDKNVAVLKCDETKLALVEEGSGGKEVSSVELDDYKPYVVPGVKDERKRTKEVRLVGNEHNEITINVPGHSWLHVKKSGSMDSMIYKKGAVKLYGGDRFFFTAAKAYSGTEGNAYVEGKSGLTVYNADSNETTLDQQLLFAEARDKSAVSLSLKWGNDDDCGYMWLTKNKRYNTAEDHVEDATTYRPLRYGTENYSYAGIVYDVTDSKGNLVYRFGLSYDGLSYVSKSTGKQMIFKTKAEKDKYSGKTAIQFARLPYGEYRVKENQYLWECDNNTGTMTATTEKVFRSGYRYDPDVHKIKITKMNSEKKKAKAYHFSATDEAITGQFSLEKLDLSTKRPVDGAVYYVTRKAAGTITTDRVVAKIKTNKEGDGIVYASNYGPLNSRTLTELPLGTYEITERQAPVGYERNSDVAVLSIKPDGSTLSVGGRIVSETSEYKIKWSTTDKSKSSSLNFNIYKQDVSTGLDAQGEARLSGAEFTVNYYDGSYTSISNLPRTPAQKWILETDESGVCMLNEKYLSSRSACDRSSVDKNGDIQLSAGTVTIQETKAPKGYTLDNSVIRSGESGIKLTDIKDGICITQVINDGNRRILEIGNSLIVGNRVVRGDFQFSKKAEDTGKALAGVKFLLENHDRTKSVIIYTDENGFYSSSSSFIKHSRNTNSGENGCGIWFGEENVDDSRGALPYGRYYLSELRCDANSGKYKSAEPVSFTIDSDNSVVELEDIIDERFPEIDSVAKYKDSGEKIISESQGKTELVDTVIMAGLEKGHRYSLHGEVIDKSSEKVVPQDGAVKDVTFTANDINMNVDVVFDIDVSDLGGSELVCYEVLTDEAYEGEIIAAHQDIKSEGQTVRVGEKKLEISKRAVSGEEELEGAELVLTDSEGEVVDRWISSKKEHIISNIAPGEYTLSEISAPAGYLRSEDIHFTVDDRIGVQKIQMIDDIARIRIKKIDDVSKKPLAGVKFSLYSAESGEKIDSRQTDKDGCIEFEYVSPGEYYLVEDSIPERYMPVETDPANSEVRIKITVESNQTENAPEKIIENHYGSVYVYKTAPDGKALEGAEIGLYEKNTDKLVAKDMTSKYGYIEFKNIPSGKYYIKEINAPDGYVNSETVIWIDTGKTIYNKEAPVVLVNEKEENSTEETTTEVTTKTTTETTTEFLTTEMKTSEKIPAKSGTPGTGDGAPLAVIIVFFAVTVLLSAGLLVYRKKFTENDDLQ